MPNESRDVTQDFAARVYDAYKIYEDAGSEVRALDGITVGFPSGRFTAIMGPSGSGKSTLMQCAAGLDRLTSGRVFIRDTEITGLSPTALTHIRRDHLGFVFQSFNLVPTLTAERNIRIPAKLAQRTIDEDFFNEIVSALGLADRLSHKPGELSGGQQQRVAVARALINKPEILFADEPTGNLDSAASDELLSFMKGSVASGQTVVMVTHDPWAASFADNVLMLADGRVVHEVANPTTQTVIDAMKQLGANDV